LAQAGPLALTAFSAAALGAGLGRAIVTTYLPVLLADIRNAPGLIGVVMLVNPITGFAVPLVVGAWSDRVRGTGGRRGPFIAGGSLLTAGGLIAIAVGSGTSYIVLALAGALAYTGLNAVTTAHRALVPVCFTPGTRPRATSAQEVALLVGGLAGIVAGGTLIDIHPWAPFALAALVVPLVALPTVVRLREPVGERVSQTEWRAFGYYRAAALRPGVREFLAAQILWVFGYAALPAFFILYAESVLDLSPSVASIWLAAFGVATGVLIVVAGRVRNPSWHPPLLGLGVVLMGAGFIGVSITTNLVPVGVALLMAASGFGLISTLGFPLFSSLIPAEEEGAYSALYFSARAVASAVALPAAGVVVATTGSYRALFVFGGAATLTALVPLLRACSIRPTRGLRLPLRWPAAGWWQRWLAAVLALYAVLVGAVLLVVGTGLERVDAWLFRLVNNNLAPGPELLWAALNPHTRNYVILNVVAVAAAALTAPRRILHVVVLMTLSWVVSLGLLEAIHVTYNRGRPEEVLGIASVITNGSRWGAIASFPSGHMAITAALVTSIGLLFPRLRTPLWLYAGAVAFTRVMFGAHFPLDVFAGTLLGYGSARLVYAVLAESQALGSLQGTPEDDGGFHPGVVDPADFMQPGSLGSLHGAEGQPP
jgi:membrane-associated phospholipid phosphatase/MFS family permease